jgi:DNA-binding GntR family transcriptional regulator
LWRGLNLEFVNITSTVLAYLRAKIISGEIPPGAKINEHDLSRKLQISRGPIREAFRVLEHEHLVVNVPRKSTYVSKISLKDLDDIYQVRRAIELSAIDLFEAKKVRQLPEVLSTFDTVTQMGTPSPGDADQVLIYREKITNFHVKMVEATGNNWLVEYYRTLYFSLARYQYPQFQQPGTGDRSIKDHKTVLNYIESGDYGKAKKFLLKHIQYSFDFQKQLLESVTGETTFEQGAMR